MGTEVCRVKVIFSLTSGGLRGWTFTQTFAKTPGMAIVTIYPTVGEAHVCRHHRPLPLPYHSTLQLVSLAFLPAPLCQFLSKEQKILQLLYRYSAGFNPAFL